MKHIDLDLDYVDSLMIIDEKGTITHSIHSNPRYGEEQWEREAKFIVNRNMIEVYPSIDPEESTLMNCMRQGVPIYRKSQTFTDYKGHIFNTQNLSIPIIKRGKVIGAIELSKDITSIQDIGDETDLKKRDGNTEARLSSKNKNAMLQFSFEDIITRNSQMLENIKKAKMISDSASSVLVYGETGTGKELFVQSIHAYSSRNRKPFVAQNCAALPETLFEAILFGTVKGAFTGAEDKAGLFEIADGGTLFLDEINSMPLNLQAKLLRAIQDGFVRRIGDAKDRKVDVRIIAAMNMDPIEAIETQRLRKDLFYRLNVMSIKLPPLRNRKEDILLLSGHFINKYNRQLNKAIQGITKDVEKLFLIYNWPGNCRELQHIIEAAMNIAEDGVIRRKHMPVYMRDALESKDIYIDEFEDIRPLNEVLESVEKRLIQKTLKKTGGNVTKASKMLELPRQTLQYKIQKYEIQI